MPRSIHRTLITRLVITAIVVSVALSAIVLFVERNQVAELVGERVAQRAALLNAQVLPVLDQPTPWDTAPFEQFTRDLRRLRLKDRTGYFVIGGVYQADGRPLSVEVDGNYQGIQAVQAFFDAQPVRVTPAAGVRHEVTRLDGKPHVFAAAPLFNSLGEPVAVLQGVLAVSAEMVQQVRTRMLRTLLAVVAIVVVTTALLYPVIIQLLRKITRFSNYLLDANLETLKVLGNAIAKRDSDTNAHNYRVTIVSVHIAEAMQLSRDIVQRLVKGAFLHDVGKIAITDSVLLKPGRLNETEYTVMKTHVDHGVDMVARTPWLQDAIEIVGSHHEKCDGSGYPQGLSRQAIPITARIFAVADVFDALTSRRPYKEPYSFEDSMRILEEGRNTHFDPDVLDTFAAIAPGLYESLSGREDDGLREEMDQLIQQYFGADLDSLAF